MFDSMQPLVTLLLVIATAVIQLLAQLGLARVAARVTTDLPSGSTAYAMRPLLLTIVAVVILMVGHLVQVTLWACRYWTWGELGGLANSLYFSLASFTTLGASELVLSLRHRATGAVEAAVGMLMFGWSTALLVDLIQRVEPLDESEWDFTLEWHPDWKPLSGLWLQARYGMAQTLQDNRTTNTDELRLVLNYKVKLY